jgi:riboflavin synthase
VFTGLVETTGRLSGRTRRGPGYRLRLETDLTPLSLGESICVSGACLTVAAFQAGWFEADVSVETNERTTLGSISVGGRLNLERSLKVGDRLGGHWVTGHVDGVAEVARVAPAGDALRAEIRPPDALRAFIAPKGSVALDGVSLTVNAVNATSFEVMLIPHTMLATTLDGLAAGRRLNVEVDLLARYVVHYLKADADSGGSADLAGALSRAGLL